MDPNTVIPFQRLGALSGSIEAQLVRDRRDFHRYPETAWTEFRTASLIARRLSELGYRLRLGADVICADDRMGVPDATVIEECWSRALAQGGDAGFLPCFRSGLTGVVAELGVGPGPLVALRFDIDALDLQESQSVGHRPAREGFASTNLGAAHACGHDGHAAIGLGVARVLRELGPMPPGTVRLIFQPAEEGVRGAKSMISAGVVDGVDALLGCHLHSGWPVGHLVGGKTGFLATSKFDAIFTGAAAHAGGSPHLGRNALMAAATAVLNLHAIPRHRDGTTRINVGRLTAGSGRNVVCPVAQMAVETRGQTSELDLYMHDAALRILRAAADMYECALELRPMGSAESAESDPLLAARVHEVAEALGGFAARPAEKGGGSEDFTYMMRRVQLQGGLATYIGLGADLGQWGHHAAEFDFDERALVLATHLLAAVALDLLARPIA